MKYNGARLRLVLAQRYIRNLHRNARRFQVPALWMAPYIFHTDLFYVFPRDESPGKTFTPSKTFSISADRRSDHRSIRRRGCLLLVLRGILLRIQVY